MPCAIIKFYVCIGVLQTNAKIKQNFGRISAHELNFFLFTVSVLNEPRSDGFPPHQGIRKQSGSCVPDL